jgi:type IV secretory pathway protease TraF
VINGTASWRPAAGEFVVLGDVSVASRDSRHWGPVTRASLFHRVLVEPDAIKARGH